MSNDDVTALPSALVESQYLSIQSPRDAKWDGFKSYAHDVAKLFTEIEMPQYNRRITNCSGFLGFTHVIDQTTGEIRLKLQDARFCRVRHCPICQWRRGLMWQARFFKALPEIIEDYPTARFLFLTLTVRNCPIGDLRDTLAEMTTAWKRMVQLKAFPAIGWVKTVEVTRGQDGSAHPHFHVLLMVKSSYFSHGFVSQARWTDLWMSALRAEYKPIVHVKSIRKITPGDCPDDYAHRLNPDYAHKNLPPACVQNGRVEIVQTSTQTSDRSNTDITQTSLQTSDYRNADMNADIPQSAPDGIPSKKPLDAGLIKALRYTLKYSTKVEELVPDKDWLREITKQLHKTRAIALGGLFKDYLSEEDPEDLIHAEEVEESEDHLLESRIWFGWRERYTKYIQLLSIEPDRPFNYSQ